MKLKEKLLMILAAAISLTGVLILSMIAVLSLYSITFERTEFVALIVISLLLIFGGLAIPTRIPEDDREGDE